MSHIMITGTTAEQALETVIRLGQVSGDLADSVLTNAATSKGYAGSSLIGSRSDHRHAMDVAPTAANVSTTTSTAGIAASFSRGDHQHYVVPGAITYGAAASNLSWSTSTAGNDADASRGDHQHYILPGVRTSQARVAGTVYTNAGSGPMWLFISALPASTATMFLNATSPLVVLGESKSITNYPVQLAGVVRAGESYYLTADVACTVGYWIEYGF